MSVSGMDVLKALTAASAVGMCLSPAPSVWGIFRHKSTGDVSVLPLVSLWASAHVWTLYGLFTNNIFPMFVTYVIGECLALGYLAVYIAFTDNRRDALRATGAVLLFIALLSTYAILGWQGVLGQSTHDVGNVIGYIGIGVVVVLYASPFETVRHVVRTKCATSMPILMILAGTTSNGLWTAYALLDDQFLVWVTNGVCVAFGVVQVGIYIAYRPRRGKVDLPVSLEILTPTLDD